METNKESKKVIFLECLQEKEIPIDKACVLLGVKDIDKITDVENALSEIKTWYAILPLGDKRLYGSNKN